MASFPSSSSSESGRISCLEEELNLEVVLLNGQSFRWKKIDLNPEVHSTSTGIIGVAKNIVWLLNRPNKEEVSYQVLHNFKPNFNENYEKILRDYFQLNVNLSELYQEWSDSDEKFKIRLEENEELLKGIRILAQDPVETVFAFICSANNNISRISKMVNKLAELYGESIAIPINGVEPQSQTFYNFPEINSFSEDIKLIEDTLRKEGFGYRAAYIAKSSKRLKELGGRSWLEGLQKKCYEDAADSLMKELSGVGPKVADCICLMSLNHTEVVPVDTHVKQITQLLYGSSVNIKGNSLKQQREIGRFYADKFGKYAGWAHSVLFTGQLKRQFDVKPIAKKKK